MNANELCRQENVWKMIPQGTIHLCYHRAKLISAKLLLALSTIKLIES